MNKPLTYKILENYRHPVTKALLYIHSMETFIYKDLKHASLNKDKSKIPTLGPYAAALSFIVRNAHKSRIN